MTKTITIGNLAITATAANVTAEQARGIEAEIKRYATWAAASAERRNLNTQRTIKEHIDAAVGFNNTIHGAIVSVSYSNL